MSASDATPLEGAGALGWTSEERPAGPACVFVDRDGVINERIRDGYVLEWRRFVWRPDALEALRTLSRAHLPIVVVSNQSCVGRGILSQDTLVDIMARMTARLVENGSPLTAWYCCPHAPDASCDCRKPKPGMLVRCARELEFDLSISSMIGDTDSDIAAGVAAGCATYRIEDGGAGFAETAETIARLTG
jgi:D-glycero-D-manno-heptose 1,7-bisphosphate phosphatase